MIWGALVTLAVLFMVLAFIAMRNVEKMVKERQRAEAYEKEIKKSHQQSLEEIKAKKKLDDIDPTDNIQL